MSSQTHEGYMSRALELAMNAPFRTSPNPTVGCVVVADSKVVGEGITQPVGGAHAEISALEAAGALSQGAQLYVTLEPCSHYGRTPPCTKAIIEAGIKEVFVGVRDPNPLVDGGGFAALEAAGIKVHSGIMGLECGRHHAPFFKFIREGRPWVVLKGALTLDGCIATMTGHSQWITGEAARIDTHRLRARCDAILVGAETARKDNPMLTVRHVDGADPIRVILDPLASLSPECKTLGMGSILVHAEGAASDRIEAIEQTGTRMLCCPRSERGLDLNFVLASLAEAGVVSLMVEGGGKVHGSFIDSQLADAGCFYLAPKLIGRG